MCVEERPAHNLGDPLVLTGVSQAQTEAPIAPLLKIELCRPLYSSHRTTGPLSVDV
ncbi:hypothetical protein SPHINGOAX6_20081 [Sphingomonas sp. AX6]|nr:hypothetical protein SPHINGOAX6_20081 [Sphingomonas sp. AX6]